MIDPGHVLPVARQARALGISRSSVYYRPMPVSEGDLRLMRRIDEIHLKYPFAGSRMLRDILHREGFVSGRRDVATLMRRMGIEALYRRPNTSRRHPHSSGLPIPAAWTYGDAARPGVGDGHHLHPNVERLCLPGGRH
jgi:putative transposase